MVSVHELMVLERCGVGILIVLVDWHFLLGDELVYIPRILADGLSPFPAKFSPFPVILLHQNY